MKTNLLKNNISKTAPYLSCWLLLLAAGTNTLYCQQKTTPAQASAMREAPFFHHLTVQNGLSQGNPYFIYKDSRGFVWLGSLDGLNRFDGRTIQLYSHRAGDANSLPAAYLQSDFFEDDQGDLWFATYETLTRYRRKSDDFENFKLTDNKGNARIGYRVVFREKTGLLWVILDNRELFRFDPAKQHWSLADSLPSTTHSLQPFFNADGTVTGCFTFGFDRLGFWQIFFDNDLKISSKNHFLPKTNSDPHGKIKYILPENDTLLWLGFSRNIAAFNPHNGQARFFDIPVGGLSSLAFWQNDYLLVATKGGGVAVFDKKSNTFINEFRHHDNDPASLGSDDAAALHVDRDGGIWVALNAIGADFTVPGKTKFQKNDVAGAWVAPGRPQGIFGMAEMPNGEVWCASRYQGIFALSPEGRPLRHFCKECPESPLSHSDVPFLLADRQGRLWAFGWNGLLVKHRQSNNFQSVFPGQAMFHGIEIADGRIIAGGFSGGLTVLADGDVSGHLSFFYKDGAFTRFFQTHNGIVLACRDLVSVWALDPLRDFARVGELPVKGDVLAFYETTDGQTIWIGTANGLVRANLRNWSVEKIYTQDDGLPNANVYAVVPDPAGDSILWLTTNRGIVRFETRRERFHTFSMADGLQSPEFNSFGFMRRRNGEIWFAGQRGVNIFRPEALRFSTFKANLLLTNIMVNGLNNNGLRCTRTGASNCSEMQEITLTFRENNLFFEFSALDFSDPQSVRYRFHLDGFDRDWHEAATRNNILYPNLPPGEYLLRAAMSNADGQWTAGERTLRIRILPPFWQTWWFRAGLMLLLSIFAYSIYSRVKIREVRLQQQVTEMETRALRAQMNPHFIFNALNAIRRFHVTGDLAGADAHFTRFSRLVRLILENSRDTLVTLQSELDLLENYIHMEQLRFGEALFEYRLEVEEGIEPEEIKIPSMILQPFAENAILHGLRHKTNGKGLLRVAVSQNFDTGETRIVIEDNGVGRKAAASFKTADEKHRSAGLDITRRRLEMLGAMHNSHKAGVEIFDLTDESGLAAGTRVEIRV